MFNRILALIFKELLSVWNDEQTRLILIMPPLIQLFIFSFAATLEVKNISIAILNKDQGLESKQLIHFFEASKNFKKIVHLSDENQIKNVLDDQKVIYVLNVDSNFTKNIKLGIPAKVEFVLDGRKSNVSQIVMGYSSKIISLYTQTLPKGNISVSSSSKVIERNWFNENLDYMWYTVPCIVCIITMLMGLLITALTVAKERECGTFDQLLVSPLSPTEILIGKAIPSFLIGVFEGTIVVTIAITCFGIPFRGNFIYLYLSMMVFLAAVIGVGLFISSVSKNQQQAILGAFFITMPAVILSGYATPIENMPQWLQTLTYVNPLRYFIVVSKGIFLKDLPPDIVWANTWPMAIIAIFTLGIARIFFQKRLE